MKNMHTILSQLKGWKIDSLRFGLKANGNSILPIQGQFYTMVSPKHDLQYGVTVALSLSGPSDTDLARNRDLEKVCLQSLDWNVFVGPYITECVIFNTVSIEGKTL